MSKGYNSRYTAFVTALVFLTAIGAVLYKVGEWVWKVTGG